MNKTIRGGAHVGANRWFGYHASWPIASLTIEPGAITLKAWPVNYRFERSAIVCLQKKTILGWSFLSIVHVKPSFAKSVTFQPLAFSKLEAALLENGYHVTTEDPSPSATQYVQYSNTWSIIGYIGFIAGIVAAIAAIVATKKG